VLASGAWASRIFFSDSHNNDLIQGLRIEPVRGQMIALALPAPLVQHVIYSCRGYVIPRNEGFVIAGSTTEQVGFDKRNTAAGISSIIKNATEIAPSLQQQSVKEIWTGLRPKNQLDDWPVLGFDTHAAGLIHASGHYRNGILLTPITAKIISELILQGKSAHNASPFSSLRFD
jgi:glycine oxidase